MLPRGERRRFSPFFRSHLRRLSSRPRCATCSISLAAPLSTSSLDSARRHLPRRSRSPGEAARRTSTGCGPSGRAGGRILVARERCRSERFVGLFLAAQLRLPLPYVYHSSAGEGKQKSRFKIDFSVARMRPAALVEAAGSAPVQCFYRLLVGVALEARISLGPAVRLVTCGTHDRIHLLDR